MRLICMRAVPGVRQAASPLAFSHNPGTTSRKRRMGTEELEARDSAPVGITEIDDGHTVDLLVDDVAECTKHVVLLDVVQIAEEHRVLQGVPESLHGLVHAPKPHVVTNVIGHHVPPPCHRVTWS